MRDKTFLQIAAIVGAATIGWFAVDRTKTEFNVWFARFGAATIFAAIAALACMAIDFSEIVHDTVLKQRKDGKDRGSDRS